MNKNIADGTEFRAILTDITPDNVSDQQIESVLDAIPNAIAEWLHESEPKEPGKYFGQIKDLFVFRLNHVPESQGAGDAEGTTEAEHYVLHVKASEGMLRAIGAKFGLEVKNG